MTTPVEATHALELDKFAKPERHRSLGIIARNTTAMLAGQILIKVFALVFSVFVVRRLGPAEYGRYSAAMAYVFLFATLSDLGTSTLSVREMARQPGNRTWMVPNVMALRSFLSLIVIGGTVLSAWLLGKTPDMVLGIFIASLALLLYAFQGPLDSVLISHERLDLSAAFNVLNQVTFIILGTVALLTGTGYIGLLLASLMGILVMGLASGLVASRVLKLRFERPALRQCLSLLQISIPFGIISVVSEFTRRFDIVFMSFVLTDAAVGWYNVPYNLILMMLLMAQSLALSMYPTMVREYDSGRGSIRDTVQRALRFLLLLSLPLAIGGTLLADRIILLLYGAQFTPAVPVMQIIVWGLPFMFLAEILGRTSLTLHLEKKVASIIFVNALITVTLDVILIPRMGVVGAAIAMVVSQFVNVIVSCVIIGWSRLFKGNTLPLLRVIGAGAIMGGLVWLIHDASFLSELDNKITLPLIIGAGAAIYGLAVLLLKAVTPNEARYIYDSARRKLGYGG